MKLFVCSDLHLEMDPAWDPYLEREVPDADVAILAGDIDSPFASSVAWARQRITQWMPTVLVAGNHEAYRHDLSSELERGLRVGAEPPKPGHHATYCLENSAVLMGDVRILGCTLWTDFELYTSPDQSQKEREIQIADAMESAAHAMNDFRAIRHTTADGQTYQWSPPASRRTHLASRAWLEAMLRRPHDGPTVVVTHHAPSKRSLSARYKGSILSPAFASNLEDLILGTQPDLWVHGHMHNSSDYQLGRTRVICNPSGYGGFENASYRDDLVIEI